MKYLCRGKRLDNGSWIEGYFWRNEQERCFIKKDNVDYEVYHNSVYPNIDLNKRVTTILLKLGITPNLKGSDYLKDAIKLCVKDAPLIHKMMKRLYPKVASINYTTCTRVERVIRHSIDTSWKKGKLVNLNDILGVEIVGKYEKLSNSEVISLIANYIKENLE